MKLHGKFFGSLFFAIFLLSLANVALAALSSYDASLFEADSFSISESLANPAHNHSGCAAEDTGVTDVDGSYPCHMLSISFSYPYSPIDSHLQTMEANKELPLVYASIFVPPQ
jgi:hypothetical protein